MIDKASKAYDQVRGIRMTDREREIFAAGYDAGYKAAVAAQERMAKLRKYPDPRELRENE